MALTLYSRTLWQELAPELPASAEYNPAGTIWVAADEEEMAEVRRKQALYASIGVRSEVLDGPALAEAEPNLREGLPGGLLVPDDAVIYPPCAARFLVDRARSLGAELIVGAAQALGPEGITLRDGSLVEAGATVNATGMWASELTPGIEMRARKGHLAITDRLATMAPIGNPLPIPLATHMMSGTTPE